MDSASEFLRMLRHEKSLTTAHRPIRLRLGHADHLADELLLPQRVQGHESVCGGFEYVITCVADTPRLPLKELIALPAELQMVTDRGQLRSICGIVAEARAGDHDGGLAVYQLVLRDALAIMEKRVNSRVFRYQNELEIVQVLFDEWRQSNSVMASAFDYELDPLFDMRQFPPREQTMQYNESDAAFVRRLLKRRGIAWTFRPGRARAGAADSESDDTPVHTLLLFSDGASLPRSAAGSVRYHRDDATEQRDTVVSWCAARRLQPGSITRHSWDYRNPLGVQFMTTTARGMADQGRSGNALAATLDDYLVEIPHAGNDVEDHWRLGQVRMNRHEFDTKCFHGEGSVRDLCAGEYFTLTGHPEIDTHPEAERDFVVTAVWMEAENNLPADLSARVRRLMGPYSPDRAMLAPNEHPVAGDGVRVRMRFDAVRRGIPLVPAFDPRADLPHPELQSAIVTGPPGEEVHCDALGRVKVRFPGMRTADHKHAHGAGVSDTPADSAWVRVSSSWAGAGPGSKQQCGTLELPRVGTEVLVAFLGGDPDRPVILSQVFNQRGEPPALSTSGGLPANRCLAGTRTREIGGQRGNQLRFDDTRGEISAQLSSDHGATQLNLGWLTQPRANGSGAPRGEGAELRTEQALSIRGRKGVLVTAEPSAVDEGTQLSRSGLVSIAELLHSVVDEMTKMANQHTGDEGSSRRLAELSDKLKRWDGGSNLAPGESGGEPMVAISAPAGIMMASPANVAIGSESEVDVVSGGNAQTTAGGSLFLRAARGISAFAQSLGIKLVAGSGNILVQAHQGAVEVKSSKRISLISSEAIHIEAPLVRIVSKGAQTEWGDGKITQRSTDEHVIKARTVVHVAPAGADPSELDLVFGKLNTDERLVLRHLQTREPIPGQRYIAHLEDGRTVEGTSDEHGRTALVQSDTLGPVRFELLP
ncbi:type VI secretion system Vgr family protein [Telluria aromaticivorans]|uniref:Type VI secretion system tip protein VgrG n=1 Tax=Telluria aromaticivorans TaxID=2725995 RepID=A0A7Y2P2C0_9BURK|nr:type VI secretion system Vgr family protein [Telluria aromaticivorans]NNG25451.1 type VI secretion system tip protein VgrG [Telluria aromaticivorans]